jgi:hypothetical protein
MKNDVKSVGVQQELEEERRQICMGYLSEGGTS